MGPTLDSDVPSSAVTNLQRSSEAWTKLLELRSRGASGLKTSTRFGDRRCEKHRSCLQREERLHGPKAGCTPARLRRVSLVWREDPTGGLRRPRCVSALPPSPQLPATPAPSIITTLDPLLLQRVLSDNFCYKNSTLDVHGEGGRELSLKHITVTTFILKVPVFILKPGPVSCIFWTDWKQNSCVKFELQRDEHQTAEAI